MGHEGITIKVSRVLTFRFIPCIIIILSNLRDVTIATNYAKSSIDPDRLITRVLVKSRHEYLMLRISTNYQELKPIISIRNKRERAMRLSTCESTRQNEH